MESDETTVVCGVVKWFDVAKGFGFVEKAGGGSDILLHANVLQNFGLSSIASGTEIELKIRETDRGQQAVEIIQTEALRKTDQSVVLGTEELEPEVFEACPIEPARMKWFDKGKGYGFANSFGNATDIFVHAEVLQRCGLTDIAPGEAICLRVLSGARGRKAIEMMPWDKAPKRDEHD